MLTIVFVVFAKRHLARIRTIVLNVLFLKTLLDKIRYFLPAIIPIYL